MAIPGAHSKFKMAQTGSMQANSRARNIDHSKAWLSAVRSRQEQEKHVFQTRQDGDTLHIALDESNSNPDHIYDVTRSNGKLVISAYHKDWIGGRGDVVDTIGVNEGDWKNLDIGVGLGKDVVHVFPASSRWEAFTRRARAAWARITRGDLAKEPIKTSIHISSAAVGSPRNGGAEVESWANFVDGATLTQTVDVVHEPEPLGK